MSTAKGQSPAGVIAELRKLGKLADANIDLAEAALLLGSLDHPDPGLDDCRDRLARIAGDLRKTPAGRGAASLAARAQALREILLDRYGFLGDRQTYDALENANLISVIERRRGLPVALSILYIDAARRVGWPVVLAGDEIVWIPGVRLSDIATRHSGRPMLTFTCERDDER